jgi:hypothetical protein
VIVQALALPCLDTAQASCEACLSLRAMAAALAGAGTTTRTGAPLGPSQEERILQRLELA